MGAAAIDLFCHWLPAEFCKRAQSLAPTRLHMLERAQKMPVMVDLETRFRVMDMFPGYQQVPSLASPAIEAMAGPEVTPTIAKVANDVMAGIVQKHPDRFRGFVAALPLNNPDASIEEAERAVTQLGAAGVQLFTNINGLPLDLPEHLQLFECMARLDRPVWLHPIRGMAAADYAGETYSKYEIWWTLGWPYETGVAMTRLAFAGIFDRHPNLRIITHHVGGIIPMMGGRLGPGMTNLGSRTPADLSSVVEHNLQEPPLQAVQRFYADTASFGEAAPIACGIDFFGIDRIVFASDMPFDPEQGPGYIRETLNAINCLDLSADAKHQILAGNAERLLEASVSTDAGATSKAVLR